MTLRSDAAAFAVIKEMCMSGYLEYARVYIQLNFIVSGVAPDETFVSDIVGCYNRYCERLGETVRTAEAESEEDALKEVRTLYDAKRRLTGTASGE